MKGRSGARWFAWLGTWFLFLCVAHGNFETTDAAFTMHAARSLWHRGDSALLTKAEGGELLGEQLGAAAIKRWERLGPKRRKYGKIGVNGHAYVWFPMGHVFLLAPFVALGESLAAALPDADARFRRVTRDFAQSYVEGHPVVTQGLICLLLPSVCMATSILLLFSIARELGASGRDAAWSALSIGLATQMFALGREQTSDGPGLTLLLGALLPVVRIHLGRSTARTAVWAGLTAGAAVLLRYQTALYVVAFAVVLVLSCRRRERWRDLWLFAAGGAPMLALFLLTNYLRFGHALVTGYPELGAWFQADPLAGLAKILFAAGRGIMWFSPLLWLGIPLVLQCRRRVELRWLAVVMFVTPLLLFMGVNGWQGGQCWGIRYVTPGVVALLAIVLPQTAPWYRWPNLWRTLVVLGWLVSVTSVVAPVRGQIQLMSQAVRAHEDHMIAAGTMAAADRTVDPADLGGWHPHYTPLVRNWLYALQSRPGRFEDDQGHPRHGSANGLRPIYGVDAFDEAAQGKVPLHWADRSGRHLWWRFWGALYGMVGWLLALPFAALGGAFAWFGWRAMANELKPVPSAVR
ncbi:MAG TPA: hypothetical protein ENI87_14045 [bacterium]|nr:hypothetical protein [bacterium]